MDQVAKSRGVVQELLRLEAHRTLLTQMYRMAICRLEPSVRLTLLFASVLKLLQMERAVRALAVEDFVEEILSLNRTMAEVTINAAYLQVAEDEEIERFHHFDTQSAFKHAANLRPHVTKVSSAEVLQKMQTAVDKARMITGRKDSDPSWSKRRLLQRAQYSDNITRVDLMAQLVRTAYAYGHSAVHGTYDALDFFISTLEMAQAPSDETRQEGLFLAISSVNFVLCTACFYMNSRFRLNLESEVIKAGKLTV